MRDLFYLTLFALFSISVTAAENKVTPPTAASPAVTSEAPVFSGPVQHPALFLVGDSIMKTGTGNGEKGPWGWGAEIESFFDPKKIHLYNCGRGGRSSRGYIEEGSWAKVLEQMQPGDFVIVQFGHNDTANSENYPDRATVTSGGDETLQIGFGDKRKIIRSYGAYLRQYIADAKTKNATLILCSPVPRNQWADGKIKRGFDGYAQWAADAAKSTGTPFIDLNSLAADRYDALGQQATLAVFNDTQHTKKAGARINAECVVAGIRLLQDVPLAKTLVSSASR